MTAVKIAGKPYAAAQTSLEAQADWLYNHPGGRVIGIIELAHTERSEPAPDVDKDRTVTLGITMLELATAEQEETLRQAFRAMYIVRTATGTLDPDGEVEMSDRTLSSVKNELILSEASRLRAGVRAWAERARQAFLAGGLEAHELRHELEALHTGLYALAVGVKE